MSKENNTRNRQPLHHFVQRIRSQTHVTSVTGVKPIRRTCILSQKQCLQPWV